MSRSDFQARGEELCRKVLKAVQEFEDATGTLVLEILPQHQKQDRTRTYRIDVSTNAERASFLHRE